MIDNVSFETILQSLNTLPDFIDYLIFKENFFKDCLIKSIIIKSNSEVNIMNQYKLDFLYNNLPNISLSLNDMEYNFNSFNFNLLSNHQCNECHSLSKTSEKLLDSIISILITNQQTKTFEEEKSLRKACELIFSLNRNSRTVISNSIKNILLKSEINNQSYSLLIHNNYYAFFIIVPYSNKELTHNEYKNFMSTNLSNNLVKFITKNQSNPNFQNLKYLIGLSISNINFELVIVPEICFLLENWQNI